MLIWFGEKKHNGGIKKGAKFEKGPTQGDRNISPISEAFSNSVYFFVPNKMWRDTGSWLFTVCFPTFFLSCIHRGNISQHYNLLKMTAGSGLLVCQGTPMRTHGHFFPVFSKSTIILRLNHSRGTKARHIASSSAVTRCSQDKREKQQN